MHIKAKAIRPLIFIVDPLCCCAFLSTYLAGTTLNEDMISLKSFPTYEVSPLKDFDYGQYIPKSPILGVLLTKTILGDAFESDVVLFSYNA